MYSASLLVVSNKTINSVFLLVWWNGQRNHLKTHSRVLKWILQTKNFCFIWTSHWSGDYRFYKQYAEKESELKVTRKKQTRITSDISHFENVEVLNDLKFSSWNIFVSQCKPRELKSDGITKMALPESAQ